MTQALELKQFIEQTLQLGKVAEQKLMYEIGCCPCPQEPSATFWFFFFF
jgi:hypothetical protein